MYKVVIMLSLLTVLLRMQYFVLLCAINALTVLSEAQVTLATSHQKLTHFAAVLWVVLSYLHIAVYQSQINDSIYITLHSVCTAGLGLSPT